jgi:hypothetical protein
MADREQLHLLFVRTPLIASDRADAASDLEQRVRVLLRIDHQAPGEPDVRLPVRVDPISLPAQIASGLTKKPPLPPPIDRQKAPIVPH